MIPQYAPTDVDPRSSNQWHTRAAATQGLTLVSRAFANYSDACLAAPAYSVASLSFPTNGSEKGFEVNAACFSNGLTSDAVSPVMLHATVMLSEHPARDSPRHSTVCLGQSVCFPWLLSEGDRNRYDLSLL